MLYKGGMCLGSVVTYLMFVPKAVPHAAGCQKLNLGSNFKHHGKIVPGVREVPPGDSRPWFGPTGNPQYCALPTVLQVKYRTPPYIPMSPARCFQMLGIFDILARLSTADFALCSDPTRFLNPLYAYLIYLLYLTASIRPLSEWITSSFPVIGRPSGPG
jgi:hypothetical protein